MPVGNGYFALAEFIFHAARDQIELFVVVVRAWLQDLQTVFDGETGCDDKDIFEKRLSCGLVTLFRICHEMSMAMTMVLPEPVAIFEHRRVKSPPSLGYLSDLL